MSREMAFNVIIITLKKKIIVRPSYRPLERFYDSFKISHVILNSTEEIVTFISPWHQINHSDAFDRRWHTHDQNVWLLRSRPNNVKNSFIHKGICFW
jgi:hypothetical protein